MIDLSNLDTQKGALDAITLLLSAKNRKIKVKKDNSESDSGQQSKLEMPADLEIEDVDEIEKKENEESGEIPETEEETQARIQKIKSDAEDADQLAADVAEIEADIARKEAEAERVKAAKQAEINDLLAKTGANGRFLDSANLKADLRKAIKKQIRLSRKTEDDFRKYNPTYSKSDLLMPGQSYPENKDIPVLYVFFDASGSFSQKALQLGLDAVKGIDDLRKRGLVKYEVRFFADHVYKDLDSARKDSGTKAFPEILETIKREHVNNVLIFTDGDFDFQTPFRKMNKVKVNGCVWWVWRYGIKAEKAFTYLQSKHRGKTFQYRS